MSRKKSVAVWSIFERFVMNKYLCTRDLFVILNCATICLKGCYQNNHVFNFILWFFWICNRPCSPGVFLKFVIFKKHFEFFKRTCSQSVWSSVILKERVTKGFEWITKKLPCVVYLNQSLFCAHRFPQFLVTITIDYHHQH